MKPHRVRMTHNLLLHYGIYKEMEVSRRFPFPSTNPQATFFTIFTSLNRSDQSSRKRASKA